MNKKASNIAQSKLYNCASRAWHSCGQYQARFIALRAVYTPTYIATQLADIDAAEQLPDFQARTGNTEVLRIEMAQLMRLATAHWQQLKRYISGAYPPDIQPIMYRSAGEHYYRAAALKSWVKLRALMNAGTIFLADHQSALLANNNMPPTFLAEFAAIAAQVETHFELLVQSRQQSYNDTIAKIAANNQVSTQLSILLADAKVIFKNEPALRRLFTLGHLRSAVQHIQPSPSQEE